MANYTINISNDSRVEKNFFIFITQPEVSGNPKVFSSVFLSTSVAGGGSGSFVFERDLYVACGKKHLQFGASVSPGHSYPIPIRLGTNSGKGITTNLVVKDGDPSLTGEVSRADEGYCTIRAGSDFHQADNYWVGIGAATENAKELSTVASFQASPGTFYQIKPHLKYHVATGNYTPGTIIKTTEIGRTKEATFDSETTTATATYQPNGIFV